MSKYKATPCDCGSMACKDWHVEPVAAMQGVNFTKTQAEAVARLLNGDGGEDLREALERIKAVDDGRSASRTHTVCYSCAEMHTIATEALKAKP